MQTESHVTAKINALKLHEILVINSQLKVIKVLNGFMYVHTNEHNVSSAVFVPAKTKNQPAAGSYYMFSAYKEGNPVSSLVYLKDAVDTMNFIKAKERQKFVNIKLVKSDYLGNPIT